MTFDVQGLLDRVSKANRLTRADYHLTLGELIAALKCAPGDSYVYFDDSDTHPGEEFSYRGYYEDLAFEPLVEGSTVVSEFLAQCRRALARTYEGYKGGDYTMDEATPLWVAAGVGDCSSTAIIGTRQNDFGDVILETREVGILTLPRG